MKDDAIYCEHPGGSEIAFIPYWRHCLLMHAQRKIIHRLIALVCVLAVLLVVVVAKGVF